MPFVTTDQLLGRVTKGSVSHQLTAYLSDFLTHVFVQRNDHTQSWITQITQLSKP